MILITIIFTIMCTACQQRQCGCRQRCPQPLMDHLRRFQCNSSILWTYCHCLVARFLRRWLGRQSKYGQSGGDLGGSTMVNLGCPRAHSAHQMNLQISMLAYHSQQWCCRSVAGKGGPWQAGGEEKCRNSWCS
jgi:hypothetical protein